MTSLAPVRQLEEAAAFLRTKTAVRPDVAVILGSGLGGITAEVSPREVVAFADVPHLPRASVAGHHGEIVLGALAGKAVGVLCGRLHYYEGFSMWQVTLPVRVLHALGARVLIVTNAAGGLNPHLNAGDLMLIADHLNLPGLAGLSPLHGLPEDDFGTRFVSMVEAYDPALLELALTTGRALKLPVASGIYAMVAGPSYETPAELRFLRAMGADAVGMSTVPEVVVAAQLQMRVLGISGITNQNLPGRQGHAEVSHEAVLRQGRAIEPRIGALIKGVLGALPGERLQ